MGSRKASLKGLSEIQVAAVLREVADRLEGIPADESARVQVDFENIHKLKIGVKRSFSGFSVKIKAKALIAEPELPAPETGSASDPAIEAFSEEPEGKPKYKKLKKRMKGDCKLIYEYLLASRLPPEAVVERFISDSALMTTYPGKGDEYYGAYNEATAVFRRAYENKNFEACKTAYRDLDQLKEECHDRYK